MLFALGALAALGLFLSLYFWKADSLPRDSALKGICRNVLDAPDARLFFGIPNYRFGAVYYAAIFLSSMFAPRLLIDSPAVFAWVGVSAGAFAMSLYLAARLLRVLKTPCRLCFLSHGVNAVLHALFLYAAVLVLKPV